MPPQSRTAREPRSMVGPVNIAAVADAPAGPRVSGYPKISAVHPSDPEIGTAPETVHTDAHWGARVPSPERWVTPTFTSRLASPHRCLDMRSSDTSVVVVPWLDSTVGGLRPVSTAKPPT